MPPAEQCPIGHEREDQGQDPSQNAHTGVVHFPARAESQE